MLCAPSLSGESFGMVLTEAFAAGTPVIASAIAGYSDVVTDGVDGILVPPADPQRLAEELQRVHHEPERLRAMGEAARRSAQRYAWPRVADRVTEVYERAIEAPEPAERRRARRALGRDPPRRRRPAPPAQRLPSLDPAPARAGSRAAPGGAARRPRGRRRSRDRADRARRAEDRRRQRGRKHRPLQPHLGPDRLWADGDSLFFRAASWYWIARAALPNRPVRRRDVTSATMIGVLMSATLPARLGEPARALALARRTGRMRETFPVLLGTLVSQTMLNLVALACSA